MRERHAQTMAKTAKQVDHGGNVKKYRGRGEALCILS